MLKTLEIIQKKRDGMALTREEIHDLISGYTRGEIPDYQMAAWLMSVYFQGMDTIETAWLTEEMAYSGEVMNLNPVHGTVVDKHSTGGVGDTTTLVLAPLVASCGVPVAKMAGRSLGHTGGTIDKLSSIPGFQTEMSVGDFVQQVRRIGLSVISASAEVAPADKKLYALRDATATVESVPLIASSVMSKKIAAGAEAIVLDVKAGNGAFMKDPETAGLLARRMVEIGHQLNKKTVAVVSDMTQPLGRAVGNALEVKEAIEVLKGQESGTLAQLSLCLGTQMLLLAGAAASEQEALVTLRHKLETGEALEKFREFVTAQGGDARIIEHPELFPTAALELPIYAESAGIISKINSRSLGHVAQALGAGRQKLEDSIDFSAGLVLQKRMGERVERGEPLVILHCQKAPEEKILQQVMQSFTLAPEPAWIPPLIYEVIH